MEQKRIGIFGGTFAPPHLGHVLAARAYLDAVKPERLYIVPTGIPPHKVAEGTPAARLEMCRAAFGNLPRTVISDYEIKKEDVSYTVLTLEHFAESGAALDLLCGSDMFLSLSRWRRSRDIFRLARIVGVSRGTENISLLEEKKAEYEAAFGADVLLLYAEPYPLSSTEIRRRIAEGSSPEGGLPASVLEIVKREHLYADGKNGYE
jgi:nicotinate-nucleotide adenylyltransferase